MRGPLGSIDVLHVDDEPDFAELAGEFLERESDRIDVRTATSADEALALLSDSNVDCIVSDHEMPGMDGIEFLQRVRDDHPDLPFILFTGKGSEEVASEAISAGVTDYLQKERGTSQYDLLANRIENAVEQRRARESAAETEQRLRTLAENTNDILWMFSHDWNELLFINTPYEDIWGRSTEELREEPQSFLQGIHPDDRSRVRDAMGRLSGGESVDIEYRVNADEDFGRWVWVQGEPVFDGGDEVTQVVGFARDITDRKERERDIQRERNRYRALFDAVPEPTVRVRFDDRDRPIVQEVNDAFEDVFGFAEADIVDRSIDDVIVPEDRADEALDIGAETSKGKRVERLVRRQTAKGEREFMFRANPLETGGDVRESIGIYVDLTEQRQRERDLKRERNRFTALYDNFPEPTITYEYDGEWPVIRAVNDAFEQVFGWSADDVVGERVDQLIVPPDSMDEAKTIDERVKEGHQVDETLRRKTADGEGVFRFRNIPIPGSNGPDGFGVYADITEQTERERELRQSHELIQALSTTFPDYTFIYNREGEYLDVITGWQGGPELYEREELIGRTVEEVLPEESAARVREAIQQSLAMNELRTIEYPMETPAATLWYEAQVAPLSDGYEGQSAVVLSAREITERKARERELERQNERLEEFASVVSHDLRNPLNVATGHLELARDECESDHLDAAARAHDRMEALIEDLLTLAREGSEIDELEVVDLGSLTERCWETVGTGGASLVLEADRPVVADRNRLRQVLENLFRNAVEHGGDDVTVTVGDLPEGFFVEDDGPGIPEGERANVFEPGYSTTDEGTGFGLSIVREIAGAHGWDIEAVEGSEGGARFEITGVQRE